MDRCSPEKALEVLESIKSFFDIEGIVYIVGMNYNSIDRLIEKKYGENTSSTISGFDYMKKMVQLPFQIPDWIEIDISEFIDHIIFKDLNGSVLAKDLHNSKQLIIRSVEWNPGEVKRFINHIILSKAVFDKPISSLIVIQALKFRPEWRRFLDFLTNMEGKNLFLNAYKENEVITPEFSIYHDVNRDEGVRRDLLCYLKTFIGLHQSLQPFAKV